MLYWIIDFLQFYNILDMWHTTVKFLDNEKSTLSRLKILPGECIVILLLYCILNLLSIFNSSWDLELKKREKLNELQP